ncbi:MAG: CoA-binding protein [Bacteroidota bacterium]
MNTTTKDKLTLVLGASLNPDRYGNLVIHRLLNNDEQVVAFGRKAGEVAGVSIETDRASIEGEEIDTITLYLNPKNQEPYEDWIVSLKPRRVIFNPGTENLPFINRLKEEGIEPVVACTLVMLSTRQY